jgi:phospholipase C
VADGSFGIHFANSGKSAAVFQVRSGNGLGGPWTYTVGAGKSLADTWAVTAGGQTAYDLSVYGPNGFLRAFKGSISGQGIANLHIESVYDLAGEGIGLNIKNVGAAAVGVRVVNVYTNQTVSHALNAGETLNRHWVLGETFGWYDFVVTVDSDASFQQQLAGHVETGRDSMTDPAIGALVVDE